MSWVTGAKLSEPRKPGAGYWPQATGEPRQGNLPGFFHHEADARAAVAKYESPSSPAHARRRLIARLQRLPRLRSPLRSPPFSSPAFALPRRSSGPPDLNSNNRRLEPPGDQIPPTLVAVLTAFRAPSCIQ